MGNRETKYYIATVAVFVYIHLLVVFFLRKTHYSVTRLKFVSSLLIINNWLENSPQYNDRVFKMYFQLIYFRDHLHLHCRTVDTGMMTDLPVLEVRLDRCHSNRARNKVSTTAILVSDK